MKHQAITLVKFKALAKRLHLPMYQAVGVLESLWIFAAIQARDGNLSRFSPLEIAGWIEWEGDEIELVNALVETRWIDRFGEQLWIHDWEEHRPNWLKGTEAKNVGRFKGNESPSPEPSDGPSDGLGSGPSDGPATGPPNLTQPNLTQPKVSSGGEGPDVVKFLADWNATKGVRQAREIKGKRLKALKARWQEKIGDDPWPKLATEAMSTKFPLRCTLGRDDGWRPDLDWFLRPDAVLNVLEGKYDWSKEEKQSGNGTKSFPEPCLVFPTT